MHNGGAALCADGRVWLWGEGFNRNISCRRNTLENSVGISTDAESGTTLIALDEKG